MFLGSNDGKAVSTYGLRSEVLVRPGPFRRGTPIVPGSLYLDEARPSQLLWLFLTWVSISFAVNADMFIHWLCGRNIVSKRF